MTENYSVYDFIEEQLPQTEGYGNCGKVIDEDGISNHSVFHQNIREEKQGDVGIFIIDSKDNVEMKYVHLDESEIQVVVNTINGDIIGALHYLDKLFKQLSKTKGNDNIKIFSCKKIGIRPVGKNSNGIHWCVLNMLLKYN